MHVRIILSVNRKYLLRQNTFFIVLTGKEILEKTIKKISRQRGRYSAEAYNSNS